MSDSIIHPFEPATHWDKRNHSAYECLSLRDIKSYFRKNYQQFVRFSKLLDSQHPRNRTERRLFEEIKINITSSFKPDFVLYGEDKFIPVFIRFVNPIKRYNNKEPYTLTISQIRLFIAYRSELAEKLGSSNITVLLITNEIIRLEYLELLRKGGIAPIAITHGYLKRCLRIIRLKVSKSVKT
jgi:hypothetical protein